MYVDNLKLMNFRNYIETDINFSQDINIIYGENAQGKTNIIEALFLCSYGKSHRTSKEREMINFDKDFFRIETSFDNEKSKEKIDILYKKDERKQIYINDILISKQSNLVGKLKSVLFSPEDLFFIKEGPSVRRRYMDMILSQFSNLYIFELQKYIKILKNRNCLLKKNRNEVKKELIIVYTEQLIEEGIKIIKNRFNFINKINKYFPQRHAQLSGSKEEVKIKYISSIEINDENIERIKEDYIEKMNNNIDKDIEYGCTTYGPHRDDYEIELDGVNIKTYGSQGQQRSAILSLKMAEMDLIMNEVGVKPIFILDDVMSELDNLRQGYLFEMIKNVQTFITCTDNSFFKNNNIGNKFLNVDKGQVYL